MDNKAKLLNMLGLATRAGKVVSGEFMTEKSVKEGKALLCIVAEDASDNTKKLFRDKCSYYEVSYYVFATKDELGHAIGKTTRASLAILDDGFKNAIEKLIIKQEED
jgi:ribosomal protein L7Ae-like RNA K-turn-binding protein